LTIEFEFNFDDYIPIEDMDDLVINFEKYLEKIESIPAGLDKITINEMNKYLGK
jgi:hypothetical protein